MLDHILALHRVSPRCFEMAGVRTGSIRDQLLRSTLLVEALGDTGMIASNKPLLVFGAGAAGMNAAIHAAKSYRTNVTVIEKDHVLFSTLSAAWSRRVNPTEFDWPHSHYPVGVFPTERNRIPLAEQSTFAPLLAAAWRVQWTLFELESSKNPAFGQVRTMLDTNARDFWFNDSGAAPDLLEVWGRWNGSRDRVTAESFGAVLSTVGLGQEVVGESPPQNCWQGYKGPRFWSDFDGFAPKAPVPYAASQIVISGGGDGGMQDLQRVATSFFGVELLDRLTAAMNKVQSPAELKQNDELRQTFLCADDVGRRACNWRNSKRGVADAMQAWHDEFKTPIGGMVDGWDVDKAQAIAAEVFRPEILDGRMRIAWVFNEATPGFCYALNRYLVLLLLALTRKLIPDDDANPIKAYPHRFIATIEPVGHRCTDKPKRISERLPEPFAECFFKKHNVTILPTRKAPEDVRKEVIYGTDLILIRHGVEQCSLFGGAPVRDQSVPFTLPH
jgi:hypothetical protein